MKRQKYHKQSFTLIELLAVIAIAGILIGIVAPAFNQMLFGGQVDNCASAVKLAFELAQAKAVTARKYVAVIFPDDRSEADNNGKKFCHGGYRLAYVTKDGNNWKFASWVPGEVWRNEVDGAMLVKAASNADDAANIPDNALLATTSLKIVSDIPDDDPVLGSTGKAIIFTPYGGAVNGSAPIYFIITEGEVDNGEYTFPNTDNYLKIKLNPLTGRVEFVED